MFDTNALLSIAFSMIANFTNVVDVPTGAVPVQPSDLQRCVIGRPNSGPGSMVHLILTHRAGTEFWIGDGAIYGYSSPGSFFTLQDPSLVTNFTGTTTLTSNQVVQIAEKALRRLVKSGDPLGRGTPTVRMASEYQGQRIPFFRVTWSKSTPGDPVAQVEIDGRTGRIVCLDLWGEDFKDRQFQEEIKRKVHLSEAVIPYHPQPGWTNLAKPTLNDVNKAIAGWLIFCHALELNPGSQTNLDDVDWSSSWLATISSRGIWSNGVCVVPACRVRFKNGNYFDSAGGVVSSYFKGSNAYYRGNNIRQAGEWGAFQGTPTKQWQDLAVELESKIIERLGLPKFFFEQWRMQRGLPLEEPPGHPIKRAIVTWRLLPPKPNGSPITVEQRQLLRLAAGKVGFEDHGPSGLSSDERIAAERYWRCEQSLGPAAAQEYILNQIPDLLLVEFDLQTGEVMGIEFYWPHLIWPALNSLAKP